MRDLLQPVRLYYLATPLFLLLDMAFGIDVRVSAFVEAPACRAGYYALCLGCGGILLWKPKLAWPVGMIESTVNIIVLFVGFVTTLLAPAQAASAEEMGRIWSANPVTFQMVLNFFLAGVVWVACFHYYLYRLGRSGRQAGGRR